jgi:hypothetical protein
VVVRGKYGVWLVSLAEGGVAIVLAVPAMLSWILGMSMLGREHCRLALDIYVDGGGDGTRVERKITSPK